MLRTARPLLNTFPRLALAGRATHARTARTQHPISVSLQPNKLATSRQTPLTLWTSFSSKPPLQPNKRDAEYEKKLAQQKLEARPDEVSSGSSVRHVVERSQAPPPPADEDVMQGLKSDLHTFKETFDLASVPKEAYALGLAGTIPYLTTSISTVYLSWALNTPWPTASNFVNGFLVDHDTASHWLHLLEPIQVGYGAVIISFLGAIHWGLEFAEKTASQPRTNFRYGLGVLAPIVAWPTVFMPVEWALTTQFMAFTILYLTDSRATRRGWAPQWYGVYRWVLTAVVGVAIFISLVGRAKVGESRSRLRTEELQDLLRQKTPGQDNKNWEKEEQKERLRLRKEKEEGEKRKEEEEKKKKEEEKKKPTEKKSGKKKDDKKDDEEKEDKKTDDNMDKAEEKSGKEDSSKDAAGNDKSGGGREGQTEGVQETQKAKKG
ncbi:hypothetical protein OQA88_8573 [Cercophora sp. LCS_1]